MAKDQNGKSTLDTFVEDMNSYIKLAQFCDNLKHITYSEKVFLHSDVL